MIHYYGKATCEHCEKKNHVLIEQEWPEDHFLSVGDEMPTEMNERTVVTCEFCFRDYAVHVWREQDTFVSFVNEKEQASINPKLWRQTVYNQTVEELETIEPTDRLMTISFEQQPFQPKHELQWMNETWQVVHSYKKEHSERNETKRMEVDFVDCYYYEIVNKNGDIKWLEVRDEEKENARFSEESPVVSAHETLYLIDESGFKSTLLIQQPCGVQYDMVVYQHLSGMQLLLIRKEEEQDLIVLDLLGDQVEELMQEAESWLHVTE